MDNDKALSSNHSQNPQHPESLSSLLPPTRKPCSVFCALMLFTTALIIGGIGGYYFATQKSQFQLIPSTSTNNLPPTIYVTSPSSVSTLPSPTLNIPSAWHTYSNMIMDFTIKYPKNWFIKEVNQNLTRTITIYIGSFKNLTSPTYSPEEETNNGYFTINTLENKSNLSLKDWFEEYTYCEGGCAPTPPKFIQEININNVPAIVATQDLPGPWGLGTKYYYFNNNSVIFELHFFYPQDSNKKIEFENIYNQILSTFRFLDNKEGFEE